MTTTPTPDEAAALPTIEAIMELADEIVHAKVKTNHANLYGSLASWASWDKKYDAARESLRAALVRALPVGEERDAELDSLRKFVGSVMKDFPEHGDVDGFALQDMAVECGLLVEQLMTAPCGEVCQCAECGQEGVTMCFRIQPALRAAIDQAKGIK